MKIDGKNGEKNFLGGSMAQYGKCGACEPYFDFYNANQNKLGCFEGTRGQL